MFMSLGLGPIGVQATLAEGIDLAKRHKFEGLDLPIVEVAQLVEANGAAAVNDMLDAAGLKRGAWGLPVNYKNEARVWQEGLAVLPRLAEAARAIGALRVSTFLMPGDNDRTYQENFDFHAGRLRPIAQILADQGIAFGLEWVGTKSLRESFAHPFIYTMEGALELGSVIGTANMGLLVDIYHVENSGATADDVRGLKNEQIVYVHVNDAVAGVPADERHDTVRDLPGYTGELNLTAFLHALRDVGYDGPVTAEPFSQRLRELPAEEAVAETSAAMHKAWQVAGLYSEQNED